MDNDYLTWFKDLDAKLARRRRAHSLIASNVVEPLKMLEQDIKANWNELLKLQRHNNDWGHPVLKERIARKYGCRPENILLTNGCSNANFLAITSLVGPGDSVICEQPGYQPLWQVAQSAGGLVKWLARRPPHYDVDPDELSRLIDRRTRLVILTNLHNPSGAALDRKQLGEIAGRVRRKNKRCRILVDEVFGDFDPGHRPAAVLDPLYITTGSLSKAYGLSHLKCGWILADSRTIEQLRPRFVLAEGNGSRYLESLSALIFARLEKYRCRAKELVAQNRRKLSLAVEPLLHQGLVEGMIPKHGCIWFPALKGVRNADRFCAQAAAGFDVQVVPGRFFGDASRFRVGFGGDPKGFSSSAARLAQAIRRYLE